MEAIIKIEEYKVHCIIGSHAYEREDEQEVTLDIAMKVDILECAQTDSIVDTVDYEQIAAVCKHLAKKRQYHLLETFAYEAVHALMNEFSPLWVKISVKKKHAVPLARAAVIELELTK